MGATGRPSISNRMNELVREHGYCWVSCTDADSPAVRRGWPLQGLRPDMPWMVELGPARSPVMGFGVSLEAALMDAARRRALNPAV